MGKPRYDPIPCSNKWSERLHNPFWSKKKVRSKARSDRALEQKKKKICVEEGVNSDYSEDEEEKNADLIILVDTDGPGIDPYTEVIPPGMVLTYESYGGSNIKSNSDSNYEPEEDYDNILGAKELPGSTSI